MVIEDSRVYFDARAKQYDMSYQRCGWYSESSQLLRFWAMVKNIDLSQSLVVDAGCGDGAFYQFCNKHFVNVRYIGIDNSQNMIDSARTAYPDALFINTDIDHHDFDSDYILSSGAFNLKTTASLYETYDRIARLFEKADVAMSVCLLSDQSPDQSELFRYFNPSNSYTFACKLTPYVVLDHSYARNDFCLTLFRR